MIASLQLRGRSSRAIDNTFEAGEKLQGGIDEGKLAIQHSGEIVLFIWSHS
jgi:hypothetical protein